MTPKAPPKVRLWNLLFFCSLLAVVGGAARGAPPSYRLVGSVALGAPDRWDYALFDPVERRLFVAHGDHTDVLDSNGMSVGRVGPLDGAHGEAVAPELGLGFADSGRSGTVTVFDLRHLQTRAIVQGMLDADALVYDPFSQRVFVMNGHAGTITVIDAAAYRVMATIGLGSALEFAATDGKGALFVNLATARTVARIDTGTAKVTGRWPIPDCVSPHGMAYDALTRRIITSCINRRLEVLDADNGRLVAQLPIGMGSDAVAIDPQRRLIFSANRDGTLSMIRIRDGSHFEPLNPLITPKGTRTMAVDPRSGRLYLITATPQSPAPANVRLMTLDPN